MKKVTVELLEGHPPKVEFTGVYMRRRELGLVLKAIDKQHRVELRRYRKAQIIKEYEAGKAARKKEEVEPDGPGRESEAGESTERHGADEASVSGVARPAKPGSAKPASTNSGGKGAAVKAAGASTAAS